jgi:ABC-type multidrug transport system fused ATPase/permease subunit
MGLQISYTLILLTICFVAIHNVFGASKFRNKQIDNSNLSYFEEIEYSWRFYKKAQILFILSTVFIILFALSYLVDYLKWGENLLFLSMFLKYFCIIMMIVFLFITLIFPLTPFNKGSEMFDNLRKNFPHGVNDVGLVSQKKLRALYVFNFLSKLLLMVFSFLSIGFLL